ncbi:glyoxylate/hydroxypyruvate reductase HPR3-like [Solanum pennellii]|uniref:Glyoxylate/hydroxypyruvate reductase HPR3-like n=1 Tax=Solanum pennellii TaxID=28526 RepID=A0ABM1G1H6_SOLPN|nr:glyoxylate/hydroxypyruvate reductase HPR3-like [Solanum pennellii]
MREAKSELPEVIVVGLPTIFKFYDEELSKKYRMLKSWESSLPLENYICKHAQSVKAMICSPSHLGIQISSSLFRLLPSLRLIVTTSTGLDHIDLVECRRRGISVASAATLFSEDVADFAVGLLIDVVRRISAAHRFVNNGLWGQFPLGSKVGSRKIGIVGLGSIGLKVAQRLEAFGCTISYQSRNKKPVPYPFYHDVYELATNCDVLVICCALTDQTHHLINKEVLLTLGKKGVIINIARGAIINEMELVQCLEEGEIAGAGLDVFENEPNVPKELLSLDNVVLTRHIAFLTEDSMRAMYELVCGNLEAFFFNRPLLSPVLDD